MKNLFKRLSTLFFGLVFLFSGTMISCNETQNGIIYKNESLKDYFENANISLSQENDDAWTVINESNLSGSLAGKSFNKTRNSTLIFTYNGDTSIDIFFDYSFTANGGGYLKINDEEIVSPTGDFNITLKQNEHFDIYIESGGGKDSIFTLNISNLFFKEEIISKLNLLYVSNGSYKVTLNSEETLIDKDKSMNISNKNCFTLEAFNTNNDYSFYAWEFNNKIVSKTNPFLTTINEDTIVKPLFISNEIALFSNGGEIFSDLNEAINNAKNNSDKIVVLSRGGYLESGDYDILEGITLYIPNDYSVTIYEGNDVIKKTSDPLNEFRRLTLKENVNLNAKAGSNIYVAGIGSGNFTGAGSGGYGHIYLESNTSIINIENGAELYCYGYITGNGTIIAESGSNIYEFFQMTSWRGGTATSQMLNNEQKVFVINQYYVQNIEANFRIYSGANVIVRTGVVVLSMFLAPASCTFIGDNGIFKISEGYLERIYDYDSDRMIYNIIGKVSISSISLEISIAGISIDSSKYVLPITNNITINVLSESEIIIEQDLALLPGVILNINEGSSMSFKDNTSLIIYDNDNWYNQKFGGINNDLIQVRYVASLNGSPKKRNSSSDSIDATINLNGDIFIDNNSCLYTTLGSMVDGTYSGGANIYSSQGSGKIHFITGLGNLTSTYQARQNGTDISYIEIPIDVAYLKNGDGTYFMLSKQNIDIKGKTITYDLTIKQWKII